MIDKFAYTISTKQVRIPNSGIIDLGNGKYRYLTERECFRLMGFDDEDLRLLELSLLEHPEKYPIMKGTGGLRKARISLDNKGKSGGARVCFIDFIFIETVYLITVYGKKEKDNLSKVERNQIKKMIEALRKTLEEVKNE